VLPAILVAAIGVQLAFSVKSIAAVLLRPSYVATEVGRRLESIVAEGESLAGDWAPFLAIDTHIRVLYTGVDFNDSGEIGVVRPAYFVFSHTPSGRRIRTLIKRSGIQMNGPTGLGSLFGAPLELWKLEYPDQGSR